MTGPLSQSTLLAAALDRALLAEAERDGLAVQLREQEERHELALADAYAGRVHVAALLGMRDEKAMSSWEQQRATGEARAWCEGER